MACPNCKCKVHYPYDDSVEGFGGTPDLERCANCRKIFDIEEMVDDEEEFQDARNSN